MTTQADGLGFEDYVTRHGAALQRYAYVLNGHAGDAEDLVQTALTKAYCRWRRIGHMGHRMRMCGEFSPDAFWISGGAVKLFVSPTS